LTREGIWTESIAVGSEKFLTIVASRIKTRMNLKIARTMDGSWYVREDLTRYAAT